jgi:DNA primase
VEYARSLTEFERFGRGWRIGRCPLPDHEDRTPSFYVYPEGKAYCYGCGFHGDVIDLYQRVEGLENSKQAAMELALRYGVPLPRRSKSWHEAQTRKNRILDVAAEIRKQSYRRRAFKAIMLPFFEAIEDEQTRHEEIAAAWRAFQRDLKRMGR